MFHYAIVASLLYSDALWLSIFHLCFPSLSLYFTLPLFVFDNQPREMAVYLLQNQLQKIYFFLFLFVTEFLIWVEIHSLNNVNMTDWSISCLHQRQEWYCSQVRPVPECRQTAHPKTVTLPNDQTRNALMKFIFNDVPEILNESAYICSPLFIIVMLPIFLKTYWKLHTVKNIVGLT